MLYNSFGKTGFQTSAIGHGTWGMGSMWGPRDDRQAIDSLIQSIDLGVNFIDTAAVYGDGHSEELIASALKTHRKKDIFIATKVPPKNMGWPAKPTTPLKQAFPKEHIIFHTERSLKNLRRDFIDLQQLHVWVDEWLDDLEWLRALEDLKASGKVKHFGISINDHAPHTALKIVELGLIDSVQVIYNIFDQSPQNELFPLCQKKQVAVIARVPYDEGALIGNLTSHSQFHKKDWRKHYFTAERLPEVCKRVEDLKKLAKKHQILSVRELALRFCFSHPAVSVIIPGMRKISHVIENIEFSNKGPLPQQVLQNLSDHVWLRNYYPVHGDS